MMTEPTETEVPVIDPGDTDTGGLPVIDSGSGDSGGDGGLITQIKTVLPSVFAVPFAPRTGAAAGILPALLLIGLSASAVSALNKVKEDNK
jgi:hypothetical protein